MAENGPDWVTLTEGETIIWQGHPSLRLVFPWLVLGVVLAVVGVVLAGFRVIPAVPWWAPLLVSLLGIAVALWAYLRNVSVTYVLTSDEVYKKRGLFTRDVAQVRLDRVQNTACSQSFAERVLGYGDVTIYTAGSETMDISLVNVPDPQNVNRLLTEELDSVAESSIRRGSL